MTSINKKDIELLDKFLNGTLPDAEHAKVVQRLEVDKDFHNQYQELTKERLLFKEQAKAALREQAKSMLREKKGSTPVKGISGTKKIIGIAASILVLLGLFWFWPSQDHIDKKAQIYTTHFELPQASHTRSSNLPGDSLFNVAMYAYEDRNFEKAVNSFSAIENRESLSTGSDKMSLFYGISLSQIGNDSMAISTLAEISENSTFYPEAQWNIALLATKTEDYKLAERIFLMLESRGQFKSQESAEILKALID